MFYVIADAERVRAAADAGRGRRHRADHRDDQGGRERAAPGRPPGPARVRRHHDRPAVAGRRTTRRTAVRNVVTVSTGTLDWERPATWTGAIDRSPCGTGTSAKMATLHAKGGWASATTFRHEGILGTVFTGRVVEETTIGDVPGDRPDDHRPGLDHRLRELRRRPDRPVPRRLHGRRHLVARLPSAPRGQRLVRPSLTGRGSRASRGRARRRGRPSRRGPSPTSEKNATRRDEMIRASLHEQPGTRQAGRIGGSVALWRSHLMSITQAPFVWVGPKASASRVRTLVLGGLQMHRVPGVPQRGRPTSKRGRPGSMRTDSRSEPVLGPVGMCGFDRAWLPENASRGRHWASLIRWQKEVPGNRQSTLALAA